MSKKVKEIYTNRFLTNHTIWGIVFLFLWSLIFTEVFGMLAIDLPLSAISKRTYLGFGSVVFSLLALLLHKRRFFPEFSGCLSCGNAKSGLILSALFFVYFIPSFIYPVATGGFKVFTVTKKFYQILTSLGYSLMAGFAEETIFRGILGSYLMRQWKKKPNRILIVMLVTSIFFGLFHATNILVGANKLYVLIQIISAAGMGFFFCAVFLRSGLLWPCIILHALNDFIAFLYTPDAEISDPAKMFSGGVSVSNFIDLALICILAVIAFYLIRPSKRAEIDELWSKKWKPISPETTGCTFRTEEPKDYRRVENMTREAFWNVYRPGCVEHYLIKCFREKPEFVKDLDIVMEIYGKICGHVMFVHSCIKTDDGKEIPTLTLGPICIDPQFKRKGYGLIMLNYACEKAEELGYGAILLEGNPDFYGKAGFETATKCGIKLAGDLEGEAPYFMVRKLKEGYLDGVSGIYSDPEGYFAADRNPEEFEKYDKSFPSKKKLSLPGQLV